MPIDFVELKPRAPGLDRTLVLFHGYGADENDLLPIAHELDPRLRAVSLQGPVALGGPMRAWFNLRQNPCGISYHPGEAREGLFTALRAVEDIIPADAPRPILLGFSQGAAVALGIALSRPDLAAAVISLSGLLPALDHEDLAGPEKLRGLRVFGAHGTSDPLLPIDLGRTVRDELTRLGVALTWREYEMGHMVVPHEIGDAAEWLAGIL